MVRADPFMKCTDEPIMVYVDGSFKEFNGQFEYYCNKPLKDHYSY